LARRGTLRNLTEYGLVLGLLAILRRLPRQASFSFASFCVDILDSAVPRLRDAAMRNLSFAMPDWQEEQRSRCVDECFHSLARLVATLAKFPVIGKQNVREWIRYEGFEHYEEAKRRGRGVLFATAHLGNWEFSAFAHALMAEPMSFVVRPLDNPYLDRLATCYRTLSGNRLLGRNDFVRPLLAALRNNEAVGILVDQNVSLAEGVFVDFFGKPACVDPGFARLAQKTGATVIPGYAIWSETEGRFVLTFDPPVPMTGDVHADTQAVHAALERAIRKHPGQWLWIHRRWKTRPAGEAGLYG
jgi:KDO2-lipid IV(A) lauroyltransferase